MISWSFVATASTNPRPDPIKKQCARNIVERTKNVYVRRRSGSFCALRRRARLMARLWLLLMVKRWEIKSIVTAAGRRENVQDWEREKWWIFQKDTYSPSARMHVKAVPTTFLWTQMSECNHMIRFSWSLRITTEASEKSERPACIRIVELE